MLCLFHLSSAGLLSNLRKVRGDTPVLSGLQNGWPPAMSCVSNYYDLALKGVYCGRFEQGI